MTSRIVALLKKEFLIELRLQHTFYGILLYMAATIFVLYLSLPNTPDAYVWNSLFWLILLFVAINTLAKSFLQEGKGRMLYYQTICSPGEFIISKLVFNVLLMILMSLLTLALMTFFLSNPLSNFSIFITIALLGGTGISLVFTLMSAISARAQQNAALMAILGFPVILPQLLLLHRLSRIAFAEVFRTGAVLQLIGLILLFDMLVVVLALILFPFLWKD